MKETKVCYKCKVEKPVVAFHITRQSKDGLSPYCRECWRGISQKNREIKRQYMKKWQRENREYLAEYRKSVSQKKRKARFHINGRRNRGTIEVPGTCSSCGGSEYRIEAHHPDYDHPKQVEWLCVACHRKEHAELRMQEHLF